MIEKLTHRVNSHSALRTTRNHYPATAFRHARRLVDEMGPIVALNLALDRGEQFG
jgi:hypothetical protein